jgi:hypothetical protein
VYLMEQDIEAAEVTKIFSSIQYKDVQYRIQLNQEHLGVPPNVFDTSYIQDKTTGLDATSSVTSSYLHLGGVESVWMS